MLKAIVHKKDGRSTLVLGLSFRNLDKFREAPGDTYINIDGQQLGIPIDVVIFSGETEQSMARDMADMIGPETQTSIDPKVADA